MIGLCCKSLPARCTWLYVIIMSCRRFRLNLHSTVAWIIWTMWLRVQILDIQATVECRFNLRRVRGMIITYSQKLCTGKYSQCSSIIWSVWLNNWVFVDKLRVFVFESRCCHLNFRCRVCFQQGVSWHSGHFRASIYSETGTWYDNNIQSCYHFHTLRRKGEIKTV